MHIDAKTALAQLFGVVGMAPSLSHIQFAGDDSSIASRHRLPTAMGVAIAAQAACIAEIWRLRTGRLQDVNVDLEASGHALNPADFLKQNGYPVTIRFVFTEPGHGFFRAMDGHWIFMAHGSPRLRNGLLNVLQCANTKPNILQAVGKWEAQPLEAVCQQEGLPLAVVRTSKEWRDHPHGRLLAASPVIEIEKICEGQPIPFHAAAARPLGDIRVLESTHILAGPGIGRCLAEQGAEQRTTLISGTTSG